MAHNATHVVNEGLVAYVRLTDGGTVTLHSGDTVPPEADAVHVATLAGRGVLSQLADQQSEPKASAGGKPKD
ncbi:hypothetical protein [Nocardioides soli]|uniref:Uncharacterized protein n=1 Tax=Nocardioides soli TaxID=1036020 RepID=A0A7W4VSM8_9ACTN|nr:hypothetical protein [Nocardioides soli]MBB3041018.1 hypothetical protein [Nocardioides soli]